MAEEETRAKMWYEDQSILGWVQNLQPTAKLRSDPSLHAIQGLHSEGEARFISALKDVGVGGWTSLEC